MWYDTNECDMVRYSMMWYGVQYGMMWYTEPEIIFNFFCKTFSTKMKFDRKISNLIVTLVQSPPLVNSLEG